MEGIIYIHVPKCGGSSFGAALRLRYLMSQATITLDQGDRNLSSEARILSDYAARQAQMRGLVGRGVRMISGHVQYDAALHKGLARNYRYVTLLRDPVERFVSHYNYLQRHHPSDDRPATLGQFLETRDAKRLASQYLFYFAGQSQTSARKTAPLIRHAITNLHRFDLVGNLNAPDSFARALKQLIRTPLPQWKRNAAPAPTQVPEDLRPQIEALCAADIAIYHSTQSRKAAA